MRPKGHILFETRFRPHLVEFKQINFALDMRNYKVDWESACLAMILKYSLESET